MIKTECKYTLIFIFIVVLLPVHALAKCVPGAPVIEIVVDSCKAISPDNDPTIRKRAERVVGWSNELAKLYIGALINDFWIYPSNNKDICNEFKIGETIKKAIYYSCCDTGDWGKCVFHGKFLGEVGGKPIDAFQ